MTVQTLAFKVYQNGDLKAFLSGERVVVGYGDRVPTNSLKLKIPDSQVSLRQAREILATTFEHGRSIIYSHRFWRDLRIRSLATSLFTGWLIESYHLVGSAAQRMTQSLAHQPDSHFKHILAVHATEEWDHGKFYAEALQNFGYHSDFIKSRIPLPETAGLATIARSVARQSELAYSFIGGFLESTRDDEATRYLNKTLGALGIPRTVLASAQSHEDLDAKLGHRGLIEELVEAYGPIRSADLAFGISNVLLFVDALVDWLEALRLEYNDDSSLQYCASNSQTVPKSLVQTEVPQLANWMTINDRQVDTPFGTIGDLPKSVLLRLRLISKLTHNRWSSSQLQHLLVSSEVTVNRLFDTLVDLRLAWYLDPIPFLKRVREARDHGASRLTVWHGIFEHWLVGIYSEEFWRWVQESARVDSQIIGWLMENYHYIRSAQDHMSAAASNCSRPGWRDVLAEHFAEELDHYLVFGRGLMKAGVRRDIIVKASPLPTTDIMCAKLTELGLTDTVAYVIADQMLQYSATYSSETNDRFYRRLKDCHPELTPAVNAFLEHDKTDSELGHNSLFDTILEELNPFDNSIRGSVYRAGDFALAFCHYLRGVKRWYGDRGWIPQERLMAYNRNDFGISTEKANATISGP